MVRNRIFLYSEEKGETGEKELRVPVNVSMIKIENQGSGTVTVTGTTNKDKVQFYAIGGIKANDFSTVLTYPNGLYNIETSGLEYMRFNLDTASNVYITLIG